MPESKFIIKEPLQNTSIETKHIIINLLDDLSKYNSIITLTNHTEEALLISENCYRLNKNTFKPIEISGSQSENSETHTESIPHLNRQQIRRLTVKQMKK